MTEKAGNSHYVGTVVEDIYIKGVAGTMPTDVFVYTGTFHPSHDGLEAAFV